VKNEGQALTLDFRLAQVADRWTDGTVFSSENQFYRKSRKPHCFLRMEQKRLTKSEKLCSFPDFVLETNFYGGVYVSDPLLQTRFLSCHLFVIVGGEQHRHIQCTHHYSITVYSFFFAKIKHMRTIIKDDAMSELTFSGPSSDDDEESETSRSDSWEEDEEEEEDSSWFRLLSTMTDAGRSLMIDSSFSSSSSSSSSFSSDSSSDSEDEDDDYFHLLYSGKFSVVQSFMMDCLFGDMDEENDDMDSPATQQKRKRRGNDNNMNNTENVSDDDETVTMYLFSAFIAQLVLLNEMKDQNRKMKQQLRRYESKVKSCERVVEHCFNALYKNPIAITEGRYSTNPDADKLMDAQTASLKAEDEMGTFVTISVSKMEEVTKKYQLIIDYILSWFVEPSDSRPFRSTRLGKPSKYTHWWTHSTDFHQKQTTVSSTDEKIPRNKCESECDDNDEKKEANDRLRTAKVELDRFMHALWSRRKWEHEERPYHHRRLFLYLVFSRFSEHATKARSTWSKLVRSSKAVHDSDDDDDNDNHRNDCSNKRRRGNTSRLTTHQDGITIPKMIIQQKDKAVVTSSCKNELRRCLFTRRQFLAASFVAQRLQVSWMKYREYTSHLKERYTRYRLNRIRKDTKRWHQCLLLEMNREWIMTRKEDDPPTFWEEQFKIAQEKYDTAVADLSVDTYDGSDKYKWFIDHLLIYMGMKKKAPTSTTTTTTTTTTRNVVIKPLQVNVKKGRYPASRPQDDLISMTKTITRMTMTIMTRQRPLYYRKISQLLCEKIL